VVAEHPSGAARHGGNATFLPCAPHVPPPSPTTQNTEGGGGGGGGVGRNTFVGPPPRASPSVWGGLRACTDLVGRAASGLAA